MTVDGLHGLHLPTLTAPVMVAKPLGRNQHSVLDPTAGAAAALQLTRQPDEPLEQAVHVSS